MINSAEGLLLKRFEAREDAGVLPTFAKFIDLFKRIGNREKVAVRIHGQSQYAGSTGYILFDDSVSENVLDLYTPESLSEKIELYKHNFDIVDENKDVAGLDWQFKWLLIEAGMTNIYFGDGTSTKLSYTKLHKNIVTLEFLYENPADGYKKVVTRTPAKDKESMNAVSTDRFGVKVNNGDIVLYASMAGVERCVVIGQTSSGKTFTLRKIDGSTLISKPANIISMENAAKEKFMLDKLAAPAAK